MTEAMEVRGQQVVSPREKRTPDELIAEGRAQATALMKVVEQAGLSRDLGGSKRHLDVEAWQTIGRFNGFLTDIVWVRPIIEGGEKVGYEARAELVRIDDGVHIIGAESSCFVDEVFEKRDGTTVPRWDNEHAVRSMAQTRAQSKLGRMAFAWVAVLAGYSGTPAEEMDGVRNKGGKSLVFPFGKHKDQAPSALPLEDLHRELSFWQKKAAEEQNPKYAANNQRLVSAIQEAIAEKSVKPEATPQTIPDPPYVPQVPTVEIPTVDDWKPRYEQAMTEKNPGAFAILEAEIQKVWFKYSGEEKTALKRLRDTCKTALLGSQASLI